MNRRTSSRQAAQSATKKVAKIVSIPDSESSEEESPDQRPTPPPKPSSQKTSTWVDPGSPPHPVEIAQRQKARQERKNNSDLEDEEYNPLANNEQIATNWTRKRRRQRTYGLDGKRQRHSSPNQATVLPTAQQQAEPSVGIQHQSPLSLPSVSQQLIQQHQQHQLSMFSLPSSFWSSPVGQKMLQNSSQSTSEVNSHEVNQESQTEKPNSVVVKKEKLDSQRPTPVVPRPTRQTSEVERNILKEMDTLIAADMSLILECEEIPEEVSDDDEPKLHQSDIQMEPPEYYHVNSRTTIINKDLVMTCDTIEEEAEVIQSESEPQSVPQRCHYDNQSKAHFAYRNLVSLREKAGYAITYIDLGDMQAIEQIREKFGVHAGLN